MTDSEGFAGRWSRLKAEARVAVPDEFPQADAAVPVPVDSQTAEPSPAPAPEETPLEEIELPPLDSLTRDSDYSLFMRADVPDHLRKDALRKLWTADPQFAVIDISECHSIDFNDVPTFPDGLLNTIYRVGSGMVEAIEAIDRKSAADAAQAAATVPTDEVVGESQPETQEKPS